MRSNEKEYFNKISETFDTGHNAYGHPAGNFRVQRRAALFAKYCHLKPGLKTLEIGCGTGEYSKALLKYDLRLLATDLSYNMLAKAQLKLEGAKNVFLLVGDIEHLPILPDSCDAVLGNSVLHHLDLESALREIFRVMKKGAKFAFSEPNMLNPQIFLQKKVKFIKKLSGDSPDETAFFRRGLKLTLEKTGFSKVAITPFDFLHPYTPAGLVRIVDGLGMFLEKTPLREIAGSLLITGEK